MQNTTSKKYRCKALRDCIKHSIAILFALSATIISIIVEVGDLYSKLCFIILICLTVCSFIFFLTSKYRYLEIYTDKIEYHYGIFFKTIATTYANDIIYCSITTSPLQKKCGSADITFHTKFKEYYFYSIEKGEEVIQLIFQMSKNNVCNLNTFKEDFGITNPEVKEFHYKSSQYIPILIRFVILKYTVFPILHFLLIGKENIILQFTNGKSSDYIILLLVYLFVLWHQEIFNIILFLHVCEQFFKIFIYTHRRLLISSDRIEYICGWTSKCHILIPMNNISYCFYAHNFWQHIYHTSNIYLHMLCEEKLCFSDISKGEDAYNMICRLVKDNCHN